MIVSGRIAPGTELSQVGLAETLGISTTPLREALAQLEAEGLVEQRRNRRPRVPPFDPLDLDAVYSNRVLLESLAIALAVPRMTADDHLALHADLDAMDAARAGDDSDAWDTAHGAFHARLVAANPAPMRLQIASLMSRSDRYRRMSVRSDTAGGRETGAEEHAAIVAAAVAGDASLAALLLARHSDAVGAGGAGAAGAGCGSGWGARGVADGDGVGGGRLRPLRVPCGFAWLAGGRRLRLRGDRCGLPRRPGKKGPRPLSCARARTGTDPLLAPGAGAGTKVPPRRAQQPVCPS